MTSKIQHVTINDIEGLKKVVDSSGLFPSSYLDEMISDYLNNAHSKEIWITYFENNIPSAIGYCAPEKLTNGTYNLLAIGVSKESQRNGIATKMLSYIEQLLKLKDGRILIIETSSDKAQIEARKFYKKNGYIQMSIIKDFWDDGEDKIIFSKKL
jgi:ribosomal protein S18 acetylase RimI-like enzyme